MMMSKKRTSDELQKDIDVIKEKLQKMKKEQKKLERQEKAEREKIERQKQIEEALDLIKIAKIEMLQNGQTFYEYLLDILNTACSDDSSPNEAHKCALPMFTTNPVF